MYKYHNPEHYPSSFDLEHNVLESGCLRLQAELTQLGPIDRASLCFWRSRDSLYVFGLTEHVPPEDVGRTSLQNVAF
jgi:hypothetical protein